VQVISPRPSAITVTATDRHSSIHGTLGVVGGSSMSSRPNNSSGALSPARSSTRPVESLRPTVRAATSNAPE
jgi:hypothetical protein